MSNQIKISQEEIEELQKIKEGIQKSINEIGQLTIRKSFLKEEIDAIDMRIQDIIYTSSTESSEESEYLKKLEEKYGKGNLDPNTGNYTIK